MFRVKIQLPKELVSQHIGSIKTGIRGGYVKVRGIRRVARPIATSLGPKPKPR